VKHPRSVKAKSIDVEKGREGMGKIETAAANIFILLQ
jgi:hypothetical protein